MAISDDVASYLMRPYARVVVPETDGTYRAEIVEFQGCIATGDTAVEALDNLEEIAAEWLRAALKRNQTIPDPVEVSEFSGRLVLRMPKSLHKKASRFAEIEGVSLNQFIVTCLAEQVGERTAVHNHIIFNTFFSNIPFENDRSRMVVYPTSTGTSAILIPKYLPATTYARS